jgi:hypothetical protein
LPTGASTESAADVLQRTQSDTEAYLARLERETSPTSTTAAELAQERARQTQKAISQGTFPGLWYLTDEARSLAAARTRADVLRAVDWRQAEIANAQALERGELPVYNVEDIRWAQRELEPYSPEDFARAAQWNTGGVDFPGDPAFGPWRYEYGPGETAAGISADPVGKGSPAHRAMQRARGQYVEPEEITPIEYDLARTHQPRLLQYLDDIYGRGEVEVAPLGSERARDIGAREAQARHAQEADEAGELPFSQKFPETSDTRPIDIEEFEGLARDPDEPLHETLVKELTEIVLTKLLKERSK